jgi:hypothetical protein
MVSTPRSRFTAASLDVAKTKKAAEIEKKVKIFPRGSLTVPV